ncbi:hypothetical protein TNIN_73051 [Trichonephila inaurata madagascariensis]|uniref:Uncharacterized protein n=1 Tax=Trichonephila inaurata madagascariensis TaxID=2747483 RepID=A0A8X7C703_9ARAC|nr:hypothetical protein TNIN_73051 [Trichonephila inaurata madagascariensis]
MYHARGSRTPALDFHLKWHLSHCGNENILRLSTLRRRGMVPFRAQGDQSEKPKHHRSMELANLLAKCTHRRVKAVKSRCG